MGAYAFAMPIHLHVPQWCGAPIGYASDHSHISMFRCMDLGLWEKPPRNALGSQD